MNAVTNFTFHESYDVRVQLIDGEPWFCLPDVCAVLDIKNPRHVVSNQLDKKGVVKSDTLTSGGKQQLTYVHEPNLYRVIFRSNKEEAKHFQDWVFNEVLPSIRKTGKYEKPQQHVSPSSPTLTKEQVQKFNNIIHFIGNNFECRDSANQNILNRLRVDLSLRQISDMRQCHFDQAMLILNNIQQASEAYARWRYDVRKQMIDWLIRDGRPWTPDVARKLKSELDLTISQHPDWTRLATLVHKPA